MTRPVIAVPARFTSHASAIRFRGLVLPRALLEAVFAAGGEPLAVLPSAPRGIITQREIGRRLSFSDGVLLPGGGDLDPRIWGGADHGEVYDVDAEQDAFDLAAAIWAFDADRPLLAICRGTQALNVARGGTLVAHMDEPHRGVITEVGVHAGSHLADLLGTDRLTVSCYHHQEIDDLGKGLATSALSIPVGTIEAIETTDEHWAIGVQWHPEDSVDTDPGQRALLEAHVEAAARHRAP